MDCSPTTLRWYRQKLTQLQQDLSAEFVEDLSRDKLLEFVAELRRQGRSAHYVRGWYQVFRTFIGWAKEEGYEVDASLVREDARRWFTMRKPIRTEVPVDTFNDEDLERIFESAGTHRNGARDRVFCQVLAGTGIRLTEALELRIEDVQGDRLQVRQGKGRKPRWVPMSGKLQLALDRYLHWHRKRALSDRLFLNRERGAWSASSATEMLRRIRIRTGLPVHAHAFRHTFATEYLRRGGEIERLRRILGHQTHEMTSRYAHLAGADLGRGIDDLTPY